MEEKTIDLSQERHFLHELSNQLIIVQGMSNLVLGSIKKTNPTMEKEIARLEKVAVSVDKIIELLKERRKHVTK